MLFGDRGATIHRPPARPCLQLALRQALQPPCTCFLVCAVVPCTWVPWAHVQVKGGMRALPGAKHVLNEC